MDDHVFVVGTPEDTPETAQHLTMILIPVTDAAGAEEEALEGDLLGLAVRRPWFPPAIEKTMMYPRVTAIVILLKGPSHMATILHTPGILHHILSVPC